MPARFRDRRDAGRRLAARLTGPGGLAGRADLLVLALPRGGVPVGYEVARALGAPLDVLVVRKLGVPGYEELAMGAIASAGAGGAAGAVRVLNPDVLRQLPDAEAALAEVTAAELRELDRRAQLYRGDRAPPAVRGRTVVLVDDGLATGATMLAAVAALRELGPACVVAAVPVGATQTCDAVRRSADACVCVVATETLDGVGRWYADFSQTTDAEVRALLDEAARPASPPPDPASVSA